MAAEHVVDGIDEAVDLLRQIVSLLGGGRPVVSPAEYYSIEEVARLLHVHVQRVRDFSRLEDDPLPIVIVPGSRKNAIIHADDLRGWVARNGTPYAVARPTRGVR